MMDLNRPVTLKKNKYPTKTTVNLAMREKSGGEKTKIAPLAVGLAVAIVLFCKFGVVDKLAAANAAESLNNDAQSQLANLKDLNADYDSVLEKYESLDISSVALSGTMQPVECLAIIDDTLVSTSKVESYTVAEGVITVKISGVTLNTVSSIYKSLMAYDSVTNVQIYTAATGEEGSGTTATLTITLVSAVTESDSGEGDAATADGTEEGGEG